MSGMNEYVMDGRGALDIECSVGIYLFRISRILDAARHSPGVRDSRWFKQILSEVSE